MRICLDVSLKMKRGKQAIPAVRASLCSDSQTIARIQSQTRKRKSHAGIRADFADERIQLPFSEGRQRHKLEGVPHIRACHQLGCNTGGLSSTIALMRSRNRDLQRGEKAPDCRLSIKVFKSNNFPSDFVTENTCHCLQSPELVVPSMT
jgi:hypothetical protein